MPDGQSSEAQIDTRTKLGRGATATIYSIRHNDKTWAAKIYHEGRKPNSAKVLAMLASPPSSTQVEIESLTYPRFAWPIAQLNDSTGAQIGYLMPLVDVRDSYTLDHYYDRVLFQKLNRPEEAALSYKLEIAQNLSTLIAELHKHRHYFIDFKPQNIRVFRRNHVVTLLDCDGFSIFGNGRRYPAELLSTDYIAPEAQRRNSLAELLAEPQDRYALAVILFQLLNSGTHPFQGILTTEDIKLNTNDEKAAAGLYPHGVVTDDRIKPRPQSTHHLWLDETRALFDQAFTTGSPTARPSARVWADHFEELLKTKALRRCEKFPKDFEHMRFKEKECPTCYLISVQASQIQKTRDFGFQIPTETKSTSTRQPKPREDSNIGWWVLGFAVIIFLIIAFNSDDKKRVINDPVDTVNLANFRLAEVLKLDQILRVDAISKDVGVSIPIIEARIEDDLTSYNPVDFRNASQAEEASVKYTEGGFIYIVFQNPSPKPLSKVIITFECKSQTFSTLKPLNLNRFILVGETAAVRFRPENIKAITCVTIYDLQPK